MAIFVKSGIAVLLVLLGGCQSFDTFKLKKLQQPSIHQARVHCSGAQNCEFERLNQMRVMNETTGRVNPEVIQQGLVRLNAKRVSDDNALFLTIPAKQHELVVRFYPISQNRAETLHLFHSFQAGQRYDLNMYRQREQKNRNLLNASTPDPLCVDLRKNGQTIRRFCKPFNAETGIAEFVEQKV